jgi:hypothetical protein
MAYSSKYKSRPFTDVFTNDTDVNRRNCGRKVPMKVLILGLGRTGTACSLDPILQWPRREMSTIC